MSGETPILYSYWRSSCSWRVRLVMNLKGISYDVKPISLTKTGGEQHSKEYREINPIEQIPALVIDGVTLIESLSIMEYLEETRTKVPLLPTDPAGRAKVREICSVIASGIQPLQNLAVVNYLEEEKRADWIKHFITRGFTAVEKLLESTSGKYCIGDNITFADCCLIPQVYNARRFHVSLESFRIITRIDEELQSHPAFIKAHPNSQSDCPQADNTNLA
ncbi:hypothetical protein NQ315_008076 [Exocentrus adspersus]|uniref:Maleylacetoacetate isomerase n=1 Tax=Exocentrus adspersus TaxID=1586481 RepID=A0AAV8VWU3_9CUCU|nr:hypothetical protein NQ315_008076 [Exocentrus adspersus]